MRESDYFEWAMAHLMALARARAKKSGVPYALTIGLMREMFYSNEGKCHLCGLPFERTPIPGTPHPRSMSVDRIKPELGYVPGNTRLVLACVNSLKYNGNDEGLVEVVQALYRSLSKDVV